MIRLLLLAAVAVAALPLPSGAEKPTTAIRLDQAGYLPEGAKIAFVLASPSSSSASAFTVNDAKSGATVYQGQLTAPIEDTASGDQVRTADFSALHQTGNFYLRVPDVGRSWSFTISPDVFRNVYRLTMRGFYVQRCGTHVDLAPEFPEYHHDACHLVGGMDKSTGVEVPHVSAKGWHDAGDYGRYVVNSGISTGSLLWAWELFHDNIEKVDLHLPESGRGVPDLLSEVRWNLDWMISMQASDGGVFHKQTSARFSGFVMPEKDQMTSLVIGTGAEPFKSSCSTADFAAVAAIASRAFQPYDQSYSKLTAEVAESAWKWLDANPNVVFHNPPGITTGEYGDEHCQDEHLWASAELARTTHKDVYKRYFLDHYSEFLNGIRGDAPPEWANVGDLALWSYVLGGATDDAAKQIRERSLAAAKDIAQRTLSNPYRISLEPKDFIWGSNGVAMNYSLQLLVANQMQADPSFVQAAQDNLHYVLGRNTFSLSWVTHIGDNAFQHPHHRLSGADGVDAPWPGLMSGGPNPGRQDPVMRHVVDPKSPPARAYIDNMGAYACNEIAINWNAPLVFVAAALTH